MITHQLIFAAMFFFLLSFFLFFLKDGSAYALPLNSMSRYSVISRDSIYLDTELEPLPLVREQPRVSSLSFTWCAEEPFTSSLQVPTSPHQIMATAKPCIAQNMLSPRQKGSSPLQQGWSHRHDGTQQESSPGTPTQQLQENFSPDRTSLRHHEAQNMLIDPFSSRSTYQQQLVVQNEPVLLNRDNQFAQRQHDGPTSPGRDTSPPCVSWLNQGSPSLTSVSCHRRQQPLDSSGFTPPVREAPYVSERSQVQHCQNLSFKPHVDAVTNQEHAHFLPVACQKKPSVSYVTARQEPKPLCNTTFPAQNIQTNWEGLCKELHLSTPRYLCIHTLYTECVDILAHVPVDLWHDTGKSLLEEHMHVSLKNMCDVLPLEDTSKAKIQYLTPLIDLTCQEISGQSDSGSIKRLFVHSLFMIDFVCHRPSFDEKAILVWGQNLCMDSIMKTLDSTQQG